MTSGSSGRMPSETPHSSFSAVFSKTPASTLTHEEECMLKTALAVVVVKQRRKSLFQQAKTKHDQHKASRVPTQDQGLLDRLFVQNPPPSNRSSLLLLSNRQHLDRIFRAALNMCSHSHASVQPNDPRLDIFHGTCSHLASQLQTWLQEEEEQGENRNASSSQEEVSQENDRNRPPTKGESTNWIRHSLMTTPCRATFQVYYHVLQFGNPRLNTTILNILIQLLLEAYHDKLLLPQGTKQPTNRKVTFSTNGSTSSLNSMPLDNNQKGNIDWLTVSWLRLTHRCVQFLSPAHLHSILHQQASNLAHLLLPLETASAKNTNGTNNHAPTLIQTYWELSSTVPTCATASSFRTGNAAPPSRLGTGAKLLLRLGLYRLLYYNNLSPGQEFQNDGSVAMQH